MTKYVQVYIIVVAMKRRFEFDQAKDAKLKEMRGIGFQDIIEALDKGKLLDDISHPGKKYTHQRMFIIEFKKYVYAVPYIVKSKTVVFLKTIFASRVLKKKYLTNKHEKK